jgi:hypothetical protein
METDPASAAGSGEEHSLFIAGLGHNPEEVENELLGLLAHLPGFVELRVRAVRYRPRDRPI